MSDSPCGIFDKMVVVELPEYAHDRQGSPLFRHQVRPWRYGHQHGGMGRYLQTMSLLGCDTTLDAAANGSHLRKRLCGKIVIVELFQLQWPHSSRSLRMNDNTPGIGTSPGDVGVLTGCAPQDTTTDNQSSGTVGTAACQESALSGQPEAAANQEALCSQGNIPAPVASSHDWGFSFPRSYEPATPSSDIRCDIRIAGVWQSLPLPTDTGAATAATTLGGVGTLNPGATTAISPVPPACPMPATPGPATATGAGAEPDTAVTNTSMGASPEPASTPAATSETRVRPTRAEASRLNGAKSRGPVTPEGKARSSVNALKYGFLAKKLIPGRNAWGEREDYHDQLRELAEEFKPQTRSESNLVEQLAKDYITLGRIGGYAEMLAVEMPANGYYVSPGRSYELRLGLTALERVITDVEAGGTFDLPAEYLPLVSEYLARTGSTNLSARRADESGNDPGQMTAILTGAVDVEDDQRQAWLERLRWVRRQMNQMFKLADDNDSAAEERARREQRGVLQSLPTLTRIKDYEDRVRRSINKSIDRLQEAQRRRQGLSGSFSR